MHSLRMLLERWRSEDVGLVPPASEDEIRRVLKILGYSATADVLALYQAIGGMENGDNELWRLWPLSEVQEENLAHPGPGFLFSDYLLSSWHYRLVPNNDDTSGVYVDYVNGQGAALVVPTLEQFLELLLSNPRRVLTGPATS